MRIVINRASCDGNGHCAVAAPDLLSLDENDEPQLLVTVLTADQLPQAERAVRICPKAALTFVD